MLITFVLAVIFLSALLFLGYGFMAWVGAAGIWLLGWRIVGVASPLLFEISIIVLVVLALVFGVPPIRRILISRFAMKLMAPVLPRLGETERIALEAGTVWWDAELFSGLPHWEKLLDFKPQPLTADEQAFMDGPVDELCAMLDDWQISQLRDLPPNVWEFLKTKGFFGMIIPKEYGGHGFSAIAHSRVVTRISTRSVAAAVTVMVPNSLGPGELLLHYGTDEQKNYFLPRLARGEEIPCFGLTGPEAGSDAAATQSTGVVEKRIVDGKEVLGLRLDWKKRYITLAPVATLIGLAFRIKDPDHLLGDKEDLGISCALISRNLPGIDIGQRHDPMGVPFMNGPIVGDNVFAPMDCLIGGTAGIGHGWRMLMESLAAGRSISL
ncbi:MAG: acyl-CoA dehydrogenase family protein, partial [Rudaea sp.]